MFCYLFVVVVVSIFFCVFRDYSILLSALRLTETYGTIRQKPFLLFLFVFLLLLFFFSCFVGVFCFCFLFSLTEILAITRRRGSFPSVRPLGSQSFREEHKNLFCFHSKDKNVFVHSYNVEFFILHLTILGCDNCMYKFGVVHKTLVPCAIGKLCSLYERVTKS